MSDKNTTIADIGLITEKLEKITCGNAHTGKCTGCGAEYDTPSLEIFIVPIMNRVWKEDDELRYEVSDYCKFAMVCSEVCGELVFNEQFRKFGFNVSKGELPKLYAKNISIYPN